MVNAALALLNLDLMARSVLPCLSTILPRYIKDYSPLMGNPLTVVYALVLIFVSPVFFKLIFSPVPANDVARRVALSRI